MKQKKEGIAQNWERAVGNNRKVDWKWQGTGGKVRFCWPREAFVLLNNPEMFWFIRYNLI